MKKYKCSLASVISQYSLIKLFNSFQIRKKKRQTGIMHKLQPNSYKDVKTPGPWQKNQEAVQSSSWKARLCDPPPSPARSIQQFQICPWGLVSCPFPAILGAGVGGELGIPTGEGKSLHPSCQTFSLLPRPQSFPHPLQFWSFQKTTIDLPILLALKKTSSPPWYIVSGSFHFLMTPLLLICPHPTLPTFSDSVLVCLVLCINRMLWK